jgi:hypothetical protein
LAFGKGRTCITCRAEKALPISSHSFGLDVLIQERRVRRGVTMIDNEKVFDSEIGIDDEKLVDDEISYKFKVKTSPERS